MQYTLNQLNDNVDKTFKSFQLNCKETINLKIFSGTMKLRTFGFIMLMIKDLDWFDFCCTALQHILGHFGYSQLP